MPRGRQVIIGPGDLVDMRQPKRDCLDAIHRGKHEFGDTDIYDIYADVCRSDSSCAPPRRRTPEKVALVSTCKEREGPIVTAK